MKNKIYIPERGDICWLNFEPIKGKEIGKKRPALVLSHSKYNKITGLIICCPISTSIRNAPSEVNIDILEYESVIVSSLIHTLSWKEREIEFIAKVEQDIINDVLERAIIFMGGEHLLK